MVVAFRFVDAASVERGAALLSSRLASPQRGPPRAPVHAAASGAAGSATTGWSCVAVAAASSAADAVGCVVQGGAASQDGGGWALMEAQEQQRPAQQEQQRPAQQAHEEQQRPRRRPRACRRQPSGSARPRMPSHTTSSCCRARPRRAGWRRATPRRCARSETSRPIAPRRPRRPRPWSSRWLSSGAARRADGKRWEQLAAVVVGTVAAAAQCGWRWPHQAGAAVVCVCRGYSAY